MIQETGESIDILGNMLSCVQYEATASSWLTKLSIKTVNKEIKLLLFSLNLLNSSPEAHELKLYILYICLYNIMFV